MENHQKFYRQRKNLLLSSIALSIYDIIGLEINVINILGNQVEISNQHNIEILLIVFWVYSLIRFFQYSSIEDSFGRKKLFGDWLKFLKDFKHKYIFQKVVRTIDDKNANSDGLGGSRPFKYEYLTKQSTLKWVYEYKAYDPIKDKDEGRVNIIEYSLLSHSARRCGISFDETLFPN